MIRVLVVDHNAVLSSDRGLYRALSSMKGFSIRLLAPSRWKEQFGVSVFESEQQSGLEAFSSTVLFGGRSHRVLYTSLGRHVRHFEPDVLYVNSEPEGYLAWQATKVRTRVRPGMKVVIDSWRNMDYTAKGFPYKFARLNSLAERRVLAAADHCVAHNESAREIFLRLGFERVSVIPPPVDTTVFFPSREASQSISAPFVIGYVGRFIPEKGIDLLFHASTRLTFDHRIVAVGGGPARTGWERLAHDLGASNRIEWKPPLPHPELPRFLRTLDALVLPSREGTYWKEQFGRVLIEAMACGVPVIGSTSGEIPHVIGDAGIVFREGDVDALVLALERIQSDSALREHLVQKGLARVRRHFAVDVIAERYARVFRRVAGETNG